MLKPIYRLLSLAAMILAALRGPVPFLRNRVRAFSHKTLARLLRQGGL